MLGAVVSPTEISLMWQAGSVSRRLPGTPQGFVSIWLVNGQCAVMPLEVMGGSRGTGLLSKHLFF